MSLLVSLYTTRTFFLKMIVAMIKIGSTPIVTNVTSQLVASMKLMMKAMSSISENIVTTPDVNNSFSASISLVTRVTSLPTGVVS